MSGKVSHLHLRTPPAGSWPVQATEACGNPCQPLGGSTCKCPVGPQTSPQQCSCLKVEPPPNLFLPLITSFPEGAPCHGSGTVPAGRAAEGWGNVPSDWLCPGTKGGRGWSRQVRPPSSHTSACLGPPLPRGGLCTAPDPGRQRRGQGAQSQEGPLGKMTAWSWGQACGACSG